MPIQNGVSIDYIKYDKPHFKFSYARIGVFLTAKTREEFSKIIYKNFDEVIEYNTDGFLSRSITKDIPIGPKMGEWKVKEI